jgi:hypothetical protein
MPCSLNGIRRARLQIRFQARPLGDAIVQRSDAPKARFELRHPAREGIAQAGEKLEQR